MREKTRISYLCFGKWCACATSLYLGPHTCSAHYVAGRGRVIPLKVTYHVTKNPNNTLRDWSRRLHWQKNTEKPAEFKKIERIGFFDASVNGSYLGGGGGGVGKKSACAKNPESHTRPIYIGKNQNKKKPGCFVVPFTLPEKPITFGVFGTKSACAKNPNLILVFW